MENTGLYNAEGKALSIADVMAMLPIGMVNRIEVIDEKGRSYVNWQKYNKVKLQVQDNGRTLKVFVSQTAVSGSFYDFAKNYIKIKDGANECSLNDKELKQVEEMQQMMDKGYELRLVHLRKGSKIVWCNKNCT